MLVGIWDLVPSPLFLGRCQTLLNVWDLDIYLNFHSGWGVPSLIGFSHLYDCGLPINWSGVQRKCLIFPDAHLWFQPQMYPILFGLSRLHHSEHSPLCTCFNGAGPDIVWVPSRWLLAQTGNFFCDFPICSLYSLPHSHLEMVPSTAALIRVDSLPFANWF